MGSFPSVSSLDITIQQFFLRGDAVDNNVPEQEQKAQELLQNLVDALRQKAKQVTRTGTWSKSL